MINKIKVGSVSYVNAKPLTYGLENEKMKELMDLHFEYPSKLATQLNNNELDIALIPVAALQHLKEYYIISDYCIGADGEVASVCLFSDVPLEEIQTILLDYQSRTSVALLKLLVKEYWKINPQLIEAKGEYENDIKNETAGLIIGDRALLQRNRNTYVYDLSLAWKEMTGLPFVFAVWVANKKIPEDFLHSFNQATGEGLHHIGEIAANIQFSGYDLIEYYTKNIRYQLDGSKLQAMQLFLKKIGD